MSRWATAVEFGWREFKSVMVCSVSAVVSSCVVVSFGSACSVVFWRLS